MNIAPWLRRVAGSQGVDSSIGAALDEGLSPQGDIAIAVPSDTFDNSWLRGCANLADCGRSPASLSDSSDNTRLGPAPARQWFAGRDGDSSPIGHFCDNGTRLGRRARAPSAPGEVPGAVSD